MPPDSAAAGVDVAWRAFDAGDLPAAIALARQALTAEPDSPLAPAALGFFLVEAGDLPAAADVLLPALARWPDHAALHWYCGYLHQRRADLPQAADCLRTACTLDSRLDEAAYALAWVLHDMDQLDEALQWSRKAMEADRQPRRMLQQGWLQQRRQRFHAAIQAYRAGLRVTPVDAPEHVRLRLHLAQCLAQTGRPREAANCLEQGLQEHPGAADLLAESAWQLRRQGEVGGARIVARALVQDHPTRALAWHLLGVLELDSAEPKAADDAFAMALEHDPELEDALFERARLQRRWGHYEAAHWLLERLLRLRPDHAAGNDLMAQVLLDTGEQRRARELLVRRLRADPHDAERWRLLAAAQRLRGRPRAAQRTLARVLRLAPENIEALRMAGWLALEQSQWSGADAAVRRLLALRPGDSAAQAQAAFVFAANGQLAEAERWAESAVATAPLEAESWRALAQVRRHQRRLDDAEHALRQALQLVPDRLDSLRDLSWVLMGAQRPGQARLALLRAQTLAPGDPVVTLELVHTHRLCGEFDTALRLVDGLLHMQPAWPAAMALKAWLLVEGSDAASAHDEAAGLCHALQRAGALQRNELHLLLRLAAAGNGRVAQVVRGVPAGQRLDGWRDALAEAVHTRGPRQLLPMAATARADYPDDPWLRVAALYLQSVDADSTAAGVALASRHMARLLKLHGGLCALNLAGRRDGTGRRPRVAYITSQLHHRLLRPLLAAHDPAQVDVYVYAARPGLELPAHVRVAPLVPQTLAESCAANAIDVVIDAGGLHPFEGQFGLLQAYARRLAPLQVGWLGAWATGGGLFDALLTDAWAVPDDHVARYEETVVHAEAGQWCWEPPLAAPPPGTAPVLRNGSVTFGVVARSLRLNDATLDACAQVLAAQPGATLRFIGAVAADWPLRRAIAARMQHHGVATSRVAFDPWRSPADYLAWCAGIDIVLDSFPGNGGLSLLEPLWMGVPVVTRAGDWAGARQACSLLGPLGLMDWVAEDAAAFVRIAVALARDTEALSRYRATLRERMRASSLLDGRTLARCVEALAQQTLQALPPPLPALPRKAQVRWHADWRLDAWLEVPHQITLPAPPDDVEPDLSVVVVLFNQAGLTRRTLQALADQRGVDFETIVIDNASSDRTPQLLQRLRGATVVRNKENLGFLRAANQGAALARGRRLVFLNSDAFLMDGALQAAVHAMDADPGIGALGGRIVLTDGGLQEAGNRMFRDGSAGGIGRGEDPFCAAARASRSTDYVSGVLLVTPRALWQRLGGFDTAFAPAYFEDTDYCARVWQAGLRVVYEPRVLVEHLEWGSAVADGVPPEILRHRALFRERHAAWLATQPQPSALPLDGDRWRSPEDRPSRRPRVLVIDNEVPHMHKGGGLPRAREMLRALGDWPVTLLPLWGVDDDWRSVYETVPHTVEVALGVGMAGLEAFLARRRGVYDVLLVSRPPNLAAIAPLRAHRPELFAGMRLVYDAEALFALREIVMDRVQGRRSSLREARERIAHEVALAEGAREVIVVSERDARHFRKAGFATRLLSHPVALRSDVPDAARRQGLLFVGALHPGTPNEDGLLWLLREVIPRLAQDDGLPPVLTVVGVCQSPAVAALGSDRVRIVGPQEDLRPHYDAARVFVAPARFAGGVPIKVIEAAANGIPVVASSVLVRQLDWQAGTDIQRAHDADAFAQGIQRLLQDDALWQRQQAAAWAQCAQRYDPARFAAALRAIVSGGTPGARAITQLK